MSEATPPVRDDDLHAFVDGQLDAERHRIVERHLETHPEDAERVAAYQAQRAAIRAALLKPDTGALPQHLTLTGILAERSAKQLRMQAWRPWLAAACLAFAVFAGGLGGWFLHTGPTAGRGQRAMTILEEQALASHAVFSVDNRHPVEVPGSQDAHLKQWFSNRLHRVIVVPNLSSLGYHLIGGRLLATERGNPAALLMYEDAEHHRMSVLLRPMGPALQMPRTTIEQDGVNGQAWIHDGLGIAVVASMPDHEIAEVATQVSDAFRPTG
jgi:anti-sigma factor RsiW